MISYTRLTPKNDRGEYPKKTTLKGWYYHSNRDENRRKIEDYVIEVRATIVGVYTPAFQVPSNWCIKLKDAKTKKVMFRGESYKLFHTKEECVDFYKEDFDKNYEAYIRDVLIRRLANINQSITSSLKRKKEIENLIQEFKIPSQSDVYKT